MDLNKMIMIYYMVGGKISDDPTPPDDTEYTITVDSNVDAIFTSDGLEFVNGVAKTKIAGTYEITAQADGYNTEKKSITVNNMNPNGYWYFDLTEQSTDPADAWMAEYSVKVLVNGEEPTRAYQYYYYSYDSNGNYSDGEIHNNVGEIILKHEVDDFDSNNTPEEFEFYVYINDNYDASAVFTNEPTLVKIDNGKAYYYLGEMNVEITEELIEYKIVADSNVENAVFKGYNYEYGYEFSFVNKVAQIAKEGSYTVFCSAPGYIGQKAYLELTESEPVKEVYFELEEVNSETGDPSKANKAEYGFEVTINGETAKGNKQVSAYFNNDFENKYNQVNFISSGKIVVKYLDENFNGYPVSSFDLDLNINGIPNGYAYESFVIENPVLTKVENGVAYYSFGVIDVTVEDESTAPNYSIYVYSNPSGATFSSDGLVFNSGLAEVSSVGEYTVNAVKPGYYDKNFVVKVTEENPNAVYKVNLDKAPVEYTITATANTSDANFSSYPYLSFNSNGVAEVYEIGEYEIECFSDGYVEQRKTVIVDESNKNPSVHFDLELDPDNPPYYSSVFYQVEVTVDGKDATGYNSFEYIMRNDDEGIYESDYYSGSGKIILGVEAYSSNRYLDTMNLEFSMDGEDYSFVLVNPVVKKYERGILYVEFDSVNIGENVDPEPEIEYTITVDSNVSNAEFSSSGLNFVNGVAKTTNPGTYVVYCNAEGYKEQSHEFYLDDSNPNQTYYFELEEEPVLPKDFSLQLSSSEENPYYEIDGVESITGFAEWDNPTSVVVTCLVDGMVSQKALLWIDENSPHREYHFDMTSNPGNSFSQSVTVSSNSSKTQFVYQTVDTGLNQKPVVNGVIDAGSNPDLVDLTVFEDYKKTVVFTLNVDDNNPHWYFYFELTPVDEFDNSYVPEFEKSITVTSNADNNVSAEGVLWVNSGNVWYGYVENYGVYTVHNSPEGFTPQSIQVEITEENPHRHVHFEFGADYLSAPNVYKLSEFKRNDSTDSNVKIVPVVNNGEFGTTDGSGRLGVRAVSRGGVEIPDIGIVKVTAWRNAESSTDIQYETESEYFAKKSLSSTSGFGAQILQLHRSGTVGGSNPTLIGDDRSKYSWLISSNRSIDNVNASASTVLLTKNVAINPCPTFAKAFISSEEDGELNKVTYLASSYWKDEGIYSGIGMNAPEVQNVNLAPFGGGEFSSDGRQVQWVVMEYANANNDTPLEDLYFEIFVR